MTCPCLAHAVSLPWMEWEMNTGYISLNMAMADGHGCRHTHTVMGKRKRDNNSCWQIQHRIYAPQQLGYGHHWRHRVRWTYVQIRNTTYPAGSIAARQRQWWHEMAGRIYSSIRQGIQERRSTEPHGRVWIVLRTSTSGLISVQELFPHTPMQSACNSPARWDARVPSACHFLWYNPSHARTQDPGSRSAEQGDCAIAIRLLLLFMRGYNLLLAVIGSIMVSIAHAPTESAGRLWIEWTREAAVLCRSGTSLGSGADLT